MVCGSGPGVYSPSICAGRPLSTSRCRRLSSGWPAAATPEPLAYLARRPTTWSSWSGRPAMCVIVDALLSTCSSSGPRRRCRRSACRTVRAGRRPGRRWTATVGFRCAAGSISVLSNRSWMTLRMPSWASISSKPRLTSSRVRWCEMNGSTSISPASQRSISCGTPSRPFTPPKDEPATRRPVIRKRGTTSSVSPLPATPATVQSPQAIRAASTAWRITATLPVASKVKSWAEAAGLHSRIRPGRPVATVHRRRGLPPTRPAPARSSDSADATTAPALASGEPADDT